jgi:hypothetical protein
MEERRMPRGEQIKEPAFQMWLKGIPVPDIQRATCGRSKVLQGRVAGWIKEWERGTQRTWSPEPRSESGSDKRRKALLRRLQTGLEQYSNYYFLWLIAARIALWTREPIELNQAHEMMDKSLRELDRIAGFIQQNRPEFSQPIRRLLTELLEAAQAGRFQPTAELFNRKTQAIGQIAEELKRAIRNQVA